LEAARPLPPSADIDPGGQFVGHSRGIVFVTLVLAMVTVALLLA
jgi:hypothetical protein